MKLYGLIGYPLGHSFSRKYFTEKFEREGISDARHENFPIESISMLPQILKDNPDLRGFSVTIPYKETIIPYLDRLDPQAAKIGAVNCVRVGGSGLEGYNTDIHGFRSSLLQLLDGRKPSAALILGTGGASKAVAYVLDEMGIPFRLVSRASGPGRISYGELTPAMISDTPLIINATPLGTYPSADTFPQIPYEGIGGGHFMFDLVYNPPMTEFMKRGAAQVAQVCNGYDMLVAQAEEAWRIWNR